MAPKLQNTVVVLYPAPGMGHVVSMVELAKLILLHHPQDFSITILLATSDFWDDPSVTSYLHHVSLSHPLISFLHFPPVSVRHSLLTCSRVAVSFDCINRSTPHVLRSLEEILETRKIAAFVIDLFCGSALSVGRDLKIPTYYFFTSGAACLAAYLYFPEIHRLCHQSFRDLRDTVLDFPGLPPLKAVHMPEPTLNRDDPAYDDMVNFCSLLRNADGIIVNTFDELEPNPIKTLSDGSSVPGAPTPPTYYIGPLIAEPQRRHDECLSWLNEQPSKSVVFLCFGSHGVFSVEQVKEIASGLERSGQRFLWVLKRPKNSNATGGQTRFVDDFDLDSALPEGFMERVGGKGKMVKSWAPQVAVLGHDSVGGFVTHCGWNSVLEAVVAGVPMAAWPLYAEQHLNRNVIVEDMKMAVAVEQREEDGFVSEDEVERRVRELMEGDGGRELRERSRKMRERCLAAWEESGSSTRALAKLVEIWIKR